MVLFKWPQPVQGIVFRTLLHSNMVLFKYWVTGQSVQLPLFYIPIWFYSNHSISDPANHIIYFYIPIWFYSNFFFRNFELASPLFYIPIWFYSNSVRLTLKILIFYILHSNMVLFKYLSAIHPARLLRILHSNMVLFKLVL